MARNARYGMRGRFVVRGCCVLTIVCCVAAAMLLPRTDEMRADTGLLFEIPWQASRAVETPGIDSAIAIPTLIRFSSPDEATITIVNRDTVSNRAGPWLLAPDQVFQLHFDQPGTYRYDCAVDPAESVTIVVRDS